MPVVLRHETFSMNDPKPYPVVVHEFRGETQDQAFAMYVQHLENDAFLQSCVQRDEYIRPDGRRVKCRVRWWYIDEGAQGTQSMAQQAHPQSQVARVGANVPVERFDANAWKSRPTNFTQMPQLVAPSAVPQAPPMQQPTPQVPQQPQGFTPRVIEGGKFDPLHMDVDTSGTKVQSTTQTG